jgi:hypothetical protein
MAEGGVKEEDMELTNCVSSSSSKEIYDVLAICIEMLSDLDVEQREAVYQAQG